MQYVRSKINIQKVISDRIFYKTFFYNNCLKAFVFRAFYVTLHQICGNVAVCKLYQERNVSEIHNKPGWGAEVWQRLSAQISA